MLCVYFFLYHIFLVYVSDFSRFEYTSLISAQHHFWRRFVYAEFTRTNSMTNGYNIHVQKKKKNITICIVILYKYFKYN
jgi:hypothetical protein